MNSKDTSWMVGRSHQPKCEVSVNKWVKPHRRSLPDELPTTVVGVDSLVLKARPKVERSTKVKRSCRGDMGQLAVLCKEIADKSQMRPMSPAEKRAMRHADIKLRRR